MWWKLQKHYLCLRCTKANVTQMWCFLDRYGNDGDDFLNQQMNGRIDELIMANFSCFYKLNIKNRNNSAVELFVNDGEILNNYKHHEHSWMFLPWYLWVPNTCGCRAWIYQMSNAVLTAEFKNGAYLKKCASYIFPTHQLFSGLLELLWYF